MSNPFYGLLPVYLPYSGTTDANGNFTTTLRPRAGFWFTGKLINEVAAGFPAVRVSDGAIPLGFGRGIRAEVAGLMAPPGAGLVVDVIAAQANTAVKGSLVGVQGPDMQSIVQAMSTAPNTVAVDTAQQQTILGTIDAPAGAGITSKTFQVPQGTQSVGYIVTFTNFGNPQAIRMTGVQTSKDYFNTGVVSGAPNDFQSVPFAIADTSVLCKVTAPALLDSFVTFLAFTYDPTLAVQPAAGSTFTVQEGANPPPWQAAASSVGIQGVALTINTDFTILAGVGGQRIRLHAVHLMTNSSAFTSIELWDGPSASGTLIGVLANDGTAVGAVPLTWDGKGRPGTAGNALVGKPTNMSAGASLWGAVGFSQAA